MGICILIFNHFIHNMEKKILIVGAGKVGSSQIREIIEATVHKPGEVVIVENSDDLQKFAGELVSMRTKEVQQLLEIEKMEAIAYLPHETKSHNIQKQNSQQGWKSRPKHNR